MSAQQHRSQQPESSLVNLPSIRIESKRVPSGLNDKADILRAPIYPALREHQRNHPHWDFADLITLTNDWRDALIVWFKLDIPNTSPISLVMNLRRGALGFFHRDWNGFGMHSEIGLRVPTPDKIDSIDLGELIGTLLHELLHLDQELNGQPGDGSYHNRQYREKARACGLIVDAKGRQTYFPTSSFTDFLDSVGVPLPKTVQRMRDEFEATGEYRPVLAKPAAPGNSKLKKWSCGCPVNVRVAVKCFNAVCLNCNQQFKPEL